MRMSEENQNDLSNLPKAIPVLETMPIRDDLVATAVNFLRNPKVQSSPLQQKKIFMKKKGLTDEEINKAIDIVGVEKSFDHERNTSATISVPTQKVSRWGQIRDFSSLAILFAGVIYGLYVFYKNYIEPLFLHHQKQTDDKLNRMEKGINNLNSDVKKNMQELNGSINILREQLLDQNVKLSTLSSNVADFKDSKQSDNALSVLQAEVTSLKALLLGTKQFPSAPAIPPVIPQWQMKSKGLPLSSEKEKSSGDGSSVETPLERSSEHSNVFQQVEETTSTPKKPVSKTILEKSSDDQLAPNKESIGNSVNVSNFSDRSYADEFAGMNGLSEHNDHSNTGSSPIKNSLNSSAMLKTPTSTDVLTSSSDSHSSPDSEID